MKKKINLKEFCKKYKLEVESFNCHRCGKKRQTDIPIIEKEAVMLSSGNCKHCGSKTSQDVIRFIDKFGENFEKWLGQVME